MQTSPMPIINTGKPTLITSEDGYRIAFRGQESEFTAYGDQATLIVDGEAYIALVDEGDGDEVECLLDEWVYRVEPVDAEVVDEEEAGEEGGEVVEAGAGEPEPGPVAAD